MVGPTLFKNQNYSSYITVSVANFTIERRDLTRSVTTDVACDEQYSPIAHVGNKKQAKIDIFLYTFEEREGSKCW